MSNKVKTIDKLYTITDAATALHKSKATIRKAVASLKIKYVPIKYSPNGKGITRGDFVRIATHLFLESE